MAGDQLVNDGPVVGDGLVWHHPASRDNLQLTAGHESVEMYTMHLKVIDTMVGTAFVLVA